jgi:8-oxo-dGTP pyrophosphatase MutT (NUDIX family)
MLSTIVNAMHRAAYRMAYPAWRFCLRQFSIRTQGAQVVVWSDEQILLIRNSYRDTYVFPGGYNRNGEDTASTASRELREETGITIPPGQLGLSFSWTYTSGRMQGHDDIYECRVMHRPVIRIDNREVVDARFVTPDRALALPLEEHVRHYLTSGR